MLQSISWQEFFTTIGLIVVGYYFITGLLFYRKEISSFIKSKSRRSPLASQLPHAERTQDDQLIGVIKAESSKYTSAPEATVSAEEVLVSQSRIAEEPIEISSITVTIEDDVASLSSEIEALVHIVAHSSREECLPLFQSLISRYASLVDTDHVEPLSQLLHDKVSEHCDFQFDLDEIRGWWSQADERIRHKSK